MFVVHLFISVLSTGVVTLEDGRMEALNILNHLIIMRFTDFILFIETVVQW